MNLNYRRHKSSNLHFLRQERLNGKVNSNLKSKHYYEDILREAKHYYHEQRDLLKAIKGFQQYLKAGHHNDQAFYLCGVCYMQIQHFQNAVLNLEHVSYQFYLKDNALLLAAIATNKIGSTTKSYQLVSSCIKINPLFEEAVCFRAKLNLQLGYFHQAESDFKKALRISPHSYLGLVGLADCCRHSGKYEEAIEFYNKSLKQKNKRDEEDHSIEGQIDLKIGICYYFLQKYQTCLDIMKDLSLNHKANGSELYYYYGLCELKFNNREKGINYLQYSIRLDTNHLITEKAFRKLILLYIQNCQFYQTQSLIKMGILYNIKVKYWQELIAFCMLTIKGEYAKALKEINPLYDLLKDQKPQKNALKMHKDQNPIDKVVVDNRFSNLKKKGSSSNSRYKKQKSKFPLLSRRRSVDKAESMRIEKINNSYQSQLARFKTQYQGTQQASSKKIFSNRQKQVVYPILLQFKAYCQFFNFQNQACLQTFQDYQTYMVNQFGKQSQFRYSKAICQIFLLIDADELDEALIKCNQAINLYTVKYGSEPQEPLLYKICILIKMTMTSAFSKEQEQKVQSKQILISTLQMIYSKHSLHSNPISQYYTALIFVLLEDYQKAKECMQATVLLSEEATPNMFYSKAILEMKMGNYFSAFKDVSASIILKKSSRAYLLRSLILLKLSGEPDLRQQVINLVAISLKNSQQSQAELLTKNINSKFVREYIIEKCLDQLQSYIEFNREDEDQLTIWVTKILFACQSYDQALISLRKVKREYYKDIYHIAQCLSIYQGEFEKGGRAGVIIKQAFDGIFLTEQEETQVLNKTPIKDYISADTAYIDQEYEKWLIILDLYRKEKYSLCIQYIEMLMKKPNQEQTEFMLRYDLAILYFIQQQFLQAFSTIESLFKLDRMKTAKLTIERILDCNFVNDECLSDFNSELFFRSAKMLSNYLSYKSIYLTNKEKTVKVHARISIPFPSFYQPNLSIQLDITYILSELSLSHIPKKIEAPWIKRVNNSIHFTQDLESTIISFDSKTNEDDKSGQCLKQRKKSIL